MKLTSFPALWLKPPSSAMHGPRQPLFANARRSLLGTLLATPCLYRRIPNDHRVVYDSFILRVPCTFVLLLFSWEGRFATEPEFYCRDRPSFPPLSATFNVKKDLLLFERRLPKWWLGHTCRAPWQKFPCLRLGPIARPFFPQDIWDPTFFSPFVYLRMSSFEYGEP